MLYAIKIFVEIYFIFWIVRINQPIFNKTTIGSIL